MRRTPPRDTENDLERPSDPRRIAVVVATSILVLLSATLVVASCSSDSDSGSDGSTTTAEASDEGDLTIPTRTAPPTTAVPIITTPEGGPELLEYHAPTEFWCYTEKPTEAQVTIGWSAPSATDVTFVFDGTELPSGIQDTVPYEVPDLTSGIGATIVFACDPASEHTIDITWTMDDGPPTQRSIHIVKSTEATPR